MGAPKNNAPAIASALRKGRAPRQFDRRGRVELLGEFAEATLAGRKPSRESLLFLAGAISAWLTRGGNLERHYLKVIANGSHNTPARVWQALQAAPPLKGTTDDASAATVTRSSPESEQEQ